MQQIKKKNCGCNKPKKNTINSGIVNTNGIPMKALVILLSFFSSILLPFYLTYIFFIKKQNENTNKTN